MKAIHTKRAPEAIGPYSQAIHSGGFIFVSGCLPIDMETGNLSTGDIAEQTRCALCNIAAILEKADSSLSRVVKTTLFVKDLKNFAAINEAYAEFFDDPKPARSCVQVAALPKDAELEIEVIAKA